MSLPPSTAPDGGTWTQVGVFGSGVVVEQLRHCLLVRPARPTPAQTAASTHLRVFAEAAVASGPGDGRALVVHLAPFTGISLSGLLTALREPLSRLRTAGGHQHLQIVTGSVEPASGHGANPFQSLADTLRVPVLAPVGTLLQVPGDTLFPVDGTAAGNWQRFSPGREGPVLVGPWHFTADWAADLPSAPVVQENSGWEVLPIPAGVALLPPDRRGCVADEITYSLPLDPRHPLVVVGRLGDTQVTPGPVAEYLRTLPDRIRGSVRLCTAAAAPQPEWAGAVADALGEPVEALTGLPLLRAGEYTSCVLRSDRSGNVEVGWEPFVSRLRYEPLAPAVPAKVTAWRSPGDDLLQITDRVYALDEDWVVEILASGLWLRRRDAPDRHETADAPYDPVEPTLLVGAPGDDLTDQAWSYVGDLTDRIVRATGARGRLRVLASAGTRTTDHGRLRLLASTGTENPAVPGTGPGRPPERWRR